MIWTREQAKALTDRALVVQQGGRDAGHADRRRPRQRALRAQQRRRRRAPRRATAWRSRRKFGKKTGTVTTAEFDDAEPAARGAQRRGDRAAVAGEPRGDAAARAADLRAESRRIFDDAAGATPEWRAVVGARRRIELSKKKDVVSAGFVETSGADPGGRQRPRDCSPTTASPRPTTTSPRARRTAPARAGRRSRSTSCGCSSRRALAAAAIDKAARSQESRRRSSPASTPSSSSRRRWPTCSPSCCSRPTRARRTKGGASSRRRAAATAIGEQIVGEKVRDLLGSGASAGADDAASTARACR